MCKIRHVTLKHICNCYVCTQLYAYITIYGIRQIDIFSMSPYEIMYMKCQRLFSGKNKKKKSKWCLLKLLPGIHIALKTTLMHRTKWFGVLAIFKINMLYQFLFYIKFYSFSTEQINSIPLQIVHRIYPYVVRQTGLSKQCKPEYSVSGV